MTTRRLDELKPHPFSLKIYGENEPIEDLVRRFAERIERGEPPLTHPIVIKPDGTIVAGWRRTRALKSIGRCEADVVEKEFKNELEERAYILDDNETRITTPYQVFQEIAARLENEQMWARQLQKEGGAKGGKRSGATRRGEAKPGEKSRQASREPRASDKVGKKYGMSGRSVEKVVKVVKEVERLEADGETERAEELKSVVNASGGKVEPAYRELDKGFNRAATAGDDVVKAAATLASETKPLQAEANTAERLADDRGVEPVTRAEAANRAELLCKQPNKSNPLEAIALLHAATTEAVKLQATVQALAQHGRCHDAIQLVVKGQYLTDLNAALEVFGNVCDLARQAVDFDIIA